jgi:hypothetical protein
VAAGEVGNGAGLLGMIRILEMHEFSPWESSLANMAAVDVVPA